MGNFIKSLIKEYLVVFLGALCYLILFAMAVLILFKATGVLHLHKATVIVTEIILFDNWIIVKLVKKYLK